MQIISNIALISINETMIIQLISFLIFVFIINRIMFRPLRNTMDERENYIQELKKGVDDAGNELSSLKVTLTKQESIVKTEAFELRADMEEAGNQKAREIFAEVKQEITEEKASIKREIDDQILEAKKRMEEESKILAVHIMEKMLERRLAQ